MARMADRGTPGGKPPRRRAKGAEKAAAGRLGIYLNQKNKRLRKKIRPKAWGML